MPVQEVYVILDSPPGPGVSGFVEIETPEGESVHVPGKGQVRGKGLNDRELSVERWRIGPLYMRTGELVGDTTDGRTLARIAADDLIAVNEEHEREAHDGEPCMENRVGLVAFVAHSVGLRPEHMLGVMEALTLYEDGHSHG